MELNKIYCENNLDTMSRMPDNFIDLTVTSPPYDNLRTYNGFSFEFEKVAKELYRVTKAGGVVVWVVGDATVNGSESGTSFRQALYFMECGFRLHDTMIYLSGVKYPDETRYYNCFEYMFVFSKGQPKVINLLNDRPNKWFKSFGKSTDRQINGSLKLKNEKVVYKDYGVRWNIWQFSNGGLGMSSGDEIALSHPAIFPEKLAADHIYSWSNEADLIYDPFMGSGTVAKMAHLQKRNWIGSEISQQYVDLANKRIAPYLAQTTLNL